MKFEDKLDTLVENAIKNNTLDDKRINNLNSILVTMRSILQKSHSLDLNRINDTLNRLDPKIDEFGYGFSHISLYINSISIHSYNNFKQIRFAKSFNGVASKYMADLIQINVEDINEDYKEKLKQIKVNNIDYFNSLYNTVFLNKDAIIDQITEKIRQNEEIKKRQINSVLKKYEINPIPIN